MLCPVCQTNLAQAHSIYGYLPCTTCKDQRSVNALPNTQVEFTSQSIKSQRTQYGADIVQPWRSGEPSREFIDHQPEQAKKLFTPKELRTAKKVWKDLK